MSSTPNQREPLAAEEDTEAKQAHGVDGTHDAHVQADGNSDKSDAIDPQLFLYLSTSQQIR